MVSSLLTAQSAITRIRTFAQGNYKWLHVTVVGLRVLASKLLLASLKRFKRLLLQSERREDDEGGSSHQ